MGNSTPENKQSEWVVKKLSTEIGKYPDDFRKITITKLVALIIEFGREWKEK